MADIKEHGTTRSGRRFALTTESPQEIYAAKAYKEQFDKGLRCFGLKDELSMYQFHLPMHVNSSESVYFAWVVDKIWAEAQVVDAEVCRVFVYPMPEVSKVVVDLSVIGEEDDLVKKLATELKAEAVPRRKVYAVSELSLQCRFQGEYNDRIYPLAGMPVCWMSEAYKTQKPGADVLYRITNGKPLAIRGLFDVVANGKTLDWANIVCKNDTAVSLGYVRFFDSK